MRLNEMISLYSSKTKMFCITKRMDYNIFQRTENYVGQRICV
jgi:hypothetical protein